MVRSNLTKWFAAESGLRLVPKGFEVTGPTFHMLYGEVPVVGVLQSGPEGGLFVEGGVVVGLLIQCRRFMETVAGFHEDGCGSATTAYGRDLEPLRRFDLSWILGVGGRIPVGRGRILLTARLERSFIDIQPTVENEKMVNRVGMVVIGYEWTLGGGSDNGAT